jgi:hypothetical protein
MTCKNSIQQLDSSGWRKSTYEFCHRRLRDLLRECLELTKRWGRSPIGNARKTFHEVAILLFGPNEVFGLKALVKVCRDQEELARDSINTEQNPRRIQYSWLGSSNSRPYDWFTMPAFWAPALNLSKWLSVYASFTGMRWTSTVGMTLNLVSNNLRCEMSCVCSERGVTVAKFNKFIQVDQGSLGGFSGEMTSFGSLACHCVYRKRFYSGTYSGTAHIFITLESWFLG